MRKPIQANVPSIGGVSTHPVKRGGSQPNSGGARPDSPWASTDEPSIGKASTGATGASATGTSTIGTERDALGPEAVRLSCPKLQSGEEAVPGYGEAHQLHQPVPGRRARRHARPDQGTPYTIGRFGLASPDGLPPEGEWGTQGEGGRRRRNLEGERGVEGPNPGNGERSENRKGRAG